MRVSQCVIDNRITLIVGDDALIMNAIVQQIDNIFRVVWIAIKFLIQSVMLRAARVNLINCNIQGVIARDQTYFRCVCIDASIHIGKSHVMSIVHKSRNDRISGKGLLSQFSLDFRRMMHGQITPSQTIQVAWYWWVASVKKEITHQIIPHITCLFNRKSQTILEFGDACIKETVSVSGNIHNRDIAW